MAELAREELSLVTPEAVRRLTALLGEPENLTTGILLTYAGIMTGAYLLRGICRFLAMWQSHVGAWNFVGNLTSMCFNKLESLSLRQAMEQLSGRERHILYMRFFQGRTQMEVAKEIGISQAQVSRLEKGALKEMRRQIFDDK